MPISGEGQSNWFHKDYQYLKVQPEAMKNLRKNYGFRRVRAFDAVWKSCQSIELATAKMCAAKGSIYAAL